MSDESDNPPKMEDENQSPRNADDDSFEAWKNWFGSVAKSTLDQTKSTFDSVRRDFNELGESVASQNVVSKAGDLGKATFDVLKKQAHAVSNLVSIEAEDLYEEPISAAKYSDHSQTDPNLAVILQPESDISDEPIREASEKSAVPKSKSENSGAWSLFRNEDKGSTDQTSTSWWNAITEKASKIMQEMDESVAENVHANNDQNPALKSNDKDWFNSLSDTMNKVFYMSDTTKNEADETIPVTVSKNGNQTIPPQRLFALQNDISTYLDQPSGAPELFDDWLDNFEINEYGNAIEDLMTRQPHVRSIYTKLVPDQIKSDNFWAHYFYRLHQIELDEATKLANLLSSDENAQKNNREKTHAIGNQSPLSDQWSMCSESHDPIVLEETEIRTDNVTPTNEKNNDWDNEKFVDDE